MEMAPNDHLARVQRFKDELKTLSDDHLHLFVRKHITTGLPIALSQDDYFELRQTIATEFHLHPTAVIIVGSCRMGFSIKPSKRYLEVSESSDIDVAMVSQNQFDYYWNGVFNYAHSNIAWRHEEHFKRFVKVLFNGWIDPRWLPRVPAFKESQDWAGFFDQLMRSRRFGRRRITARLYRSWERLEAYQSKNVNLCLAELRA